MAKSTRKSKQRPLKKTPRRMSRPAIAKLVADLCERLDKQVWIAEAIEKAAAPTDNTIVASWPMLKVLELAAAAHFSALHQATGFAKIIYERVAR